MYRLSKNYLKGTLIKMFWKDTTYGVIILIYNLSNVLCKTQAGEQQIKLKGVDF